MILRLNFCNYMLWQNHNRRKQCFFVSKSYKKQDPIAWRIRGYRESTLQRWCFFLLQPSKRTNIYGIFRIWANFVYQTNAKIQRCYVWWHSQGYGFVSQWTWQGVNSLRNRIAHHEPICFRLHASEIDTCYIVNEYQKIQTLFSWMGIDSRSMLYGLDHVQSVCSKINALK